MFRLPHGVPLAELPNDFKPPPIGTSKEVRTLLERAFPGCEHNVDQMLVDGKTFWIEFSYRPDPKSEMVEHVRVRSDAGSGAMLLMKQVCELLDVSLIDCQTTEIADFAEQTEDSMNRFSEWRDRAMRDWRSAD